VVELELSTPHAMPGDKIVVTYRYKKGTPSKRDWVGFYKGTRPLDSNQYYTQKYTDTQPTGRVEFVVPNRLGVCELRFFQNANYELIARSAALHVGPRVTLTARIEGLSVVVRRQQLSGTASTWDWVAMYAFDEQDCTKMIGAHQYLSAEPDATTILKCPKQPGAYEVRYFAGASGYSPLAKSNKLIVDDNDSVVVTQIGSEKLSVVCDVASLDAHARHWLAVFAVGEADNHSYIGSYVYCPAWKVPVTLDAPKTPGDYEVRLLQRGSYQVIKASNMIRIAA